MLNRPRPTTPALSAYAAGRTILPLAFHPKTGRPVYPIAGASPEGDPPAAAPPAAAPPAPPEPPKFEPITSQADLDRILGNRLAREREKFADYDDLKAKAAELDQKREAEKTEAEKAVEAARKEGENAGRATGNERLINAEARALAAEAGFINPRIAIGSIDLKGVKVADDGTVDAAAIKAKLEDLAKSDPYLVGAGTKRPRPDHSQGSGGDRGRESASSVASGREMFANRKGAAKPKTSD